MNGALPPSSIETRWLVGRLAHQHFPTGVEPVKLTLRSRSSAISVELSTLRVGGGDGEDAVRRPGLGQHLGGASVVSGVTGGLDHHRAAGRDSQSIFGCPSRAGSSTA
jgi:hypothetical protein